MGTKFNYIFFFLLLLIQDFVKKWNLLVDYNPQNCGFKQFFDFSKIKLNPDLHVLVEWGQSTFPLCLSTYPVNGTKMPLKFCFQIAFEDLDLSTIISSWYTGWMMTHHSRKQTTIVPHEILFYNHWVCRYFRSSMPDLSASGYILPWNK